MSLNLNQVSLAGRLTRDPQVKALANDKVVADFGVAINRRWKGADGEVKEEATFLDIEAWGRTAELVGQYLAKGSPVYIDGRIRVDQWQDKDGSRRSKMKIIAESVQFIAPRKESAGSDHAQPVAAGSRPHAVEVAGEVAAEKDEPPF
ncbi:MAG: single-stranded DNA-binding protein [Planctomycetes bacterium]|nr:single-stranded DNA-binding protein [Planctomycetota bacterium]